MKVAIVGYGRMGQMVHSLIEGSGVHEAVSIVDPSSSSGRVTSLSLTDAVLSRADVAIDFSVPSAVRSNVAVYAHTGTPAVIGTTGWGSDLSAIDASGVRIIHSGNFSIGVALFLSLVSEAARLFDPFDHQVNQFVNVFLYSISRTSPFSQTIRQKSSHLVRTSRISHIQLCINDIRNSHQQEEQAAGAVSQV